MSPYSATFDAPLLRKLDHSGPRYISYPTADWFHAQFSARDYLAAVTERRLRHAGKPLSLYLHISFCASICYYCACNKVVRQDAAKGAVYLDYLKRNITMQGALFAGMNRIDQLHLRGGTPTYVTDAQMEACWATGGAMSTSRRRTCITTLTCRTCWRRSV